MMLFIFALYFGQGFLCKFAKRIQQIINITVTMWQISWPICHNFYVSQQYIDGDTETRMTEHMWRPFTYANNILRIYSCRFCPLKATVNDMRLHSGRWPILSSILSTTKFATVAQTVWDRLYETGTNKKNISLIV